MPLHRFGRLSAAVGLAASTALLSGPATAQFYYARPAIQPPPPQVYYPPQPEQGDAAPPGRMPQWVDPDDQSPPPVRSYEPSRRARAASREDAPSGDAPPETRANPEPESHGASTTTPVHVVSLREGPSGGAPVIGTLRPGMQLEVLGTSNGWVQVRSPAGTGWAYGSYLAGSPRGFASASANDGASEPAHAGDGASSPPHDRDVVSAPDGKAPAAGNTAGGSSAHKPPGTANPALAGGGPALAGGGPGPTLSTGESGDAKRSGISSP